MKIGILETGVPPEETKDVIGSYPKAFEKLLAGNGFEFETWACLEGVFPDSINDADGWLITGSKSGAYEDLPWIPKLEAFIRDVYANDIPTVGVCFGHQILAQALGGKVEKFSEGWSVGRIEYDLEGFDKPIPLYGWHQDQVVTLPPDAKVVGSTPFCQYAALAYGNKVYSIQPHPEFTAEFVDALFDAHKDVLPDTTKAAAADSLADRKPTESDVVAESIAAFFKKDSA